MEQPESGSAARRSTSVVFSAALVAEAVRDAAAAVVDSVASILPAEARILVTADRRLLQRDAARTGLRTSLGALAELAEGIAPRAAESPTAVSSVAAALAGIAGALPAVLPQLVSHRQLAGEEVVADAWDAAAAVAGALAADQDLAATVVLDGTRLLPERTDASPAVGVAGARARLAAAAGALAAGTRQERTRPAEERDAGWLAAADAVAAAIRDVLLVLDAPSAGGGPSPYARALADESIDRAGLDGVLVLGAPRVEAAQSVERRPLWLADRIHTTGTAVLSYALLDPVSSTVLVADVATGHQERFGEIGARLDAVTSSRRRGGAAARASAASSAAVSPAAPSADSQPGPPPAPQLSPPPGSGVPMPSPVVPPPAASAIAAPPPVP